jgi:membrane protease YdiL (CAAX protease family)
MKWIAPILAYLAVGIGLFQFHSAWGALLGFHFVIVVSLLLARSHIPADVLLKITDIRWSVLSILLCGSSGVALYYLWGYFGFADNLPAQIESLGLTASTWIPFIAYFALANPFVEEYFWRGFLGNRKKGPSISDFVYSGFHALILFGRVRAGLIIFSLVVLALAGWLWRQIAREDRGLLAPVLGHMAADFTILVAIYWKV